MGLFQPLELRGCMYILIHFISDQIAVIGNEMYVLHQDLQLHVWFKIKQI